MLKLSVSLQRRLHEPKHVPKPRRADKQRRQQKPGAKQQKLRSDGTPKNWPERKRRQRQLPVKTPDALPKQKHARNRPSNKHRLLPKRVLKKRQRQTRQPAKQNKHVVRQKNVPQQKQKPKSERWLRHAKRPGKKKRPH